MSFSVFPNNFPCTTSFLICISEPDGHDNGKVSKYFGALRHTGGDTSTSVLKILKKNRLRATSLIDTRMLTVFVKVIVLDHVFARMVKALNLEGGKKLMVMVFLSYRSRRKSDSSQQLATRVASLTCRNEGSALHGIVFRSYAFLLDEHEVFDIIKNSWEFWM